MFNKQPKLAHILPICFTMWLPIPCVAPTTTQTLVKGILVDTLKSSEELVTKKVLLHNYTIY